MKKLILFVVLLGSVCAFAQQDSMENAKAPALELNPPPNGHAVIEPQPVWYNHELMASWAVLFVGGTILLAMIFAKPMQNWPRELHARLIVVVLSVVAALYLITAGWSSEQTAPAFGLLGAIVGYVLGRGDSSGKGQSNPPDA
jgi:peptidoglycan/LPS O-acetylase OafA/YrhL